jgi:UDP-GlcNAc:undecaprenyl-phosphate GlcNAc-1-phosphate transferase
VRGQLWPTQSFRAWRSRLRCSTEPLARKRTAPTAQLTHHRQYLCSEGFMRAYVAVFLVAAVASTFITPLVRAAALRLGAVSAPGGRNVNATPIARCGGIAMCAAFLLAIAALSASHASVAATLHTESRRFGGLLAGGVGLCALGAVDDARPLPATYKFCAQAVAAAVAFACGFRIDAIDLPFIGILSMGVFALPVTVLWIVGITNAINLIDGLDGLAGGVVFFAAITNLVVAYVTGATFVAVTMSAVLGSVLGFLIFNFNPARIFMGDSGSYFLGFVLGTMSLAGGSQKASTAVALLVPILSLGLPIMDTLFSIVRRFIERRPLFSADRKHIHHRLLDMGLTHRRAVLILYAVCLVLTSAAIGVSLGRAWTVGVALLVSSIVMAGVAQFAGSFERAMLLGRQRARLRSRHTELLRRVLPDATALLAAARTEDDVWSALQTVLSRGGLSTAELLSRGKTLPEPLGRWGDSIEDRAHRVDLLSLRFALGADDLARAELVFFWQSDFGDVSPQTEVLLQVVVDVIAQALLRLGSDCAPRPASDDAMEIERPSSPTFDVQPSS